MSYTKDNVVVENKTENEKSVASTTEKTQSNLKEKLDLSDHRLLTPTGTKFMVQGGKVQEFLRVVTPYCVRPPKITKNDVGIVLKPDVVADTKKYEEISLSALSVGATRTSTPPGFRISLTESDISPKSFYLHECDIEDGGPQPRTEINPSDPETQTLFELIKANGQAVPINVYPSPTTRGKYRIAEGHRRRMVIFNMLRQDRIWVVSEPRSELKAYEDAFDLNNARKSLSATDQGRFFQTMMQKFPTVYPNQKAIAERRKLTPAYVSYILSSTELVEWQKEKLATEVLTRVNRLTEGQLRPVNRVESEEAKTMVLQTVAEQNLSMRQGEKLVEAVNANPEPTPEFVAEEAKRIAEAKVERYRKEADKTVAKTDRARDKIVAAGEEYPEDLMKAVYGHLGLKNKGKVDPEKAKAYALTVFAVMFEETIARNELDDVLRKADLWQ